MFICSPTVEKQLLSGCHFWVGNVCLSNCLYSISFHNGELHMDNLISVNILQQKVFNFFQVIFFSSTGFYLGKKQSTLVYSSETIILIRLQITTPDYVQQFCLELTNGPFAWSGHMVQNHTCWYASCTLGLLKQSNSYLANLTCLWFGCPAVQLVFQHAWFCTMYVRMFLFYFFCMYVMLWLRGQTYVSSLDCFLQWALTSAY